MKQEEREMEPFILVHALIRTLQAQPDFDHHAFLRNLRLELGNTDPGYFRIASLLEAL